MPAMRKGAGMEATILLAPEDLEKVRLGQSLPVKIMMTLACLAEDVMRAQRVFALAGAEGENVTMCGTDPLRVTRRSVWT